MHATYSGNIHYDPAVVASTFDLLQAGQVLSRGVLATVSAPVGFLGCGGQHAGKRPIEDWSDIDGDGNDGDGQGGGGAGRRE